MASLLKPLKINYRRIDWGYTHENPYSERTKFIMSVESAANLETYVDTSDLLETSAIDHKRMHMENLLRKTFPSIQQLYHVNQLIKTMLTAENPNYFKHKENIDLCVKAVDEAVKLLDPSTYEMQRA